MSCSCAGSAPKCSELKNFQNFLFHILQPAHPDLHVHWLQGLLHLVPLQVTTLGCHHSLLQIYIYIYCYDIAAIVLRVVGLLLLAIPGHVHCHCRLPMMLQSQTRCLSVSKTLSKTCWTPSEIWHLATQTHREPWRHDVFMQALRYHQLQAQHPAQQHLPRLECQVRSSWSGEALGELIQICPKLELYKSG